MLVFFLSFAILSFSFVSLLSLGPFSFPNKETKEKERMAKEHRERSDVEWGI